ncbi:hypothetical protein PsYK624_006220 [Phanerochaete sordida]|uniref:Uncharacterized protein n=1 Tax=Phanerochaete sordida TaxID=48140 RepID=A0A9P3FXS7_9APHY|nr:hypothetical protein PsYK624_006220 [Phanerochaete sordida]
MVRQVFRHRQDTIGLRSHEIWDTALQLHPTDGESEEIYGTESVVKKPRKNWQLPPQPTNHPLRSMKYLKKIVLEHMAEHGEIEKVSVRVKKERNEDGEREQIVTSKRTGVEAVPPEKQRPREDLKPSLWIWRYTGSEEQLNLEESAAPNAPSQANLKELFDGSVEPDFGSKIKFIDVPDFSKVNYAKKGMKTKHIF